MKHSEEYEKGEIRKDDKVVIVLSHYANMEMTINVNRKHMDEASICNDSATIYSMFFGHSEESLLDEYQEYAIDPYTTACSTNYLL